MIHHNKLFKSTMISSKNLNLIINKKNDELKNELKKMIKKQYFVAFQNFN